MTKKRKQDHYPSKEELEREYDMPGLSSDEVRSAFMTQKGGGEKPDAEPE